MRPAFHAQRGEDQRITTVILSGDFNRHHPAWGTNHIQPQFIEDASELINFFQTHGLHGCLPRGTATFWPLNDPGKSTTIDQTVTNRPEQLIKCHLYHENYGSDHRATYSEWNLRPRRQPAAKAKKAYDRADWAKIAEDVVRQIGPWKEVKTRSALDEAVERLTEATATAIASFISDRHASIGFDDFHTEVTPLANAGLAQGSPLSPILFTFFNSDLVDQPVTFHGSASAFIDDYFH
ncbi:hypothetical protein CBS147330_9923 [Penicillium roqueforti]|nr:hypothetical protein CBS147330_9923 [Penicillium roqueforti]